MRIVAQRVTRASVSVGGRMCGAIESGFCLLVGVAPGDTEDDVRALADKIVNLRVFSDDAGKMNRSLADVGGRILAISQFTLYADCRKGRRPSFTAAAPPELGEALYDRFVQLLRERGVHVETGEFGAEMLVEILNDGPVTIILDTDEL